MLREGELSPSIRFARTSRRDVENLEEGFLTSPSPTTQARRGPEGRRQILNPGPIDFASRYAMKEGSNLLQGDTHDYLGFIR